MTDTLELDRVSIPDVMAPGGTRILGDRPVVTLSDHRARYGPVGHASTDLIDQVAAAGLRGRGGAAFPTAIKMRAVRDAGRRSRGRLPVVVANATEGEPASAKDKVLLCWSPHLVLDGMVAAARAVGAGRAVLCIDRRSREAIMAVKQALSERARRDPVLLEVAETPSRYTTGEETALVAWLNGGAAKPTFAPPRPSDRGVGGAPTLVDNVETIANVALIARYGADAYRLVGLAEEPGSLLVTVGGAVERPGVVEIEIGARLAGVLRGAGAGRASGVLVGGYFGSWLDPAEARAATLSARGLEPFGASLGCGLLAVVPHDQCPLQEVSRVLHWLAASSAGQCGACVNGLPALAGAFDHLVAGDAGRQGSGRLDRWVPMVVGRGACKLPDGAVRFLDSSRRVFADHIESHRVDGACRPNGREWLPTPRPGEWR